jgi:SAM-dependent methyltransferase
VAITYVLVRIGAGLSLCILKQCSPFIVGWAVPSTLGPDAFGREDEAPDSQFYEEPRFVYHIDQYAVAAVTEGYRRFLPPGGAYLDLMSSWVSHFPPEMPANRLVGLGMNERELQRNAALTEFTVHDLNLDPRLDFSDAVFDGVVICVSVQYLTQPVQVFAEVRRVLKPGAPLVVTFSNRCFPSKAVLVWRSLSDADHASLIAYYMKEAGGFEAATTYDLSPARTLIGLPDDPDLRARIAAGEVYTDPLYAVVGIKA